jgi:hypothetical protein
MPTQKADIYFSPKVAMILGTAILSAIVATGACLWFFFASNDARQNRREFVAFGWGERFQQTGVLWLAFFVGCFLVVSLVNCSSGGGNGCYREWDGRNNPIVC